MNDSQENASDFAGFDQDFSKEKSVAPVLDGSHVLAIKGLTRRLLKSKDCWVSIHVLVVASKIQGENTREFLGKEFEIQYFLAFNSDKSREINIDLLKKFLAMVAGQNMPGLFSTHFNEWAKLVVGLHIVATQKTGEKTAEGKQFVNYYPEKAYTLTDEDRRLLGSGSAGDPDVIPF